MLGREQRVDRDDDPRRRAGEERHRRLDAVRQEVGDGVGGADPEPAEEIGGARDLGAELAPRSRRDHLVLRPGPELEGDGRAVGKAPGGGLELLVKGARLPAVLDGHFRLDGLLVREGRDTDHALLPRLGAAAPWPAIMEGGAPPHKRAGRGALLRRDAEHLAGVDIVRIA